MAAMAAILYQQPSTFERVLAKPHKKCLFMVNSKIVVYTD
jgi:hypothetical protein